MYPVCYPCLQMPYCPGVHSFFLKPYETEVGEKTKDYRKESTETSEQSPAGMQNLVGKEEINKDQLVPGFVPCHNHGSVDYTSIADGHVHQCLDITHPPTPREDGTHIHYTEGYVLFEDGHTHCYSAWSGPAISVGDGMHVHYYDFYTSENDGHRHRITGVDMPAPGTL